VAEVGLLPFARVALEVSKTVIPRYRSRFSKHQFTQPQLLAILCLMRCEDWTFREAEVRLAETCASAASSWAKTAPLAALAEESARRGPWNDCANLPTVVEAASRRTRIGLVLALRHAKRHGQGQDRLSGFSHAVERGLTRTSSS